MNHSTSNSWLVYSKISVAPVLRLFCLPYAGGNTAIFNSWPGGLPKTVQVCGVELPGRRRRFAEPAYSSLPPLVHDLAAALKPYVDLPYAIFGISLGALIGFELAHEMLKLGHPPMHLLVANCRAPHLLYPDLFIHGLPEPQLVARVKLLGVAPEAVVQHAELMKMMLPTLRADFKLAETYTYSPKPPFAFPITGFLGSEDPTVTREQLSAWQEHSHGPYKLHVIRGPHNLVESHSDALLEGISAELNCYLNARSSAGQTLGDGYESNT